MCRTHWVAWNHNAVHVALAKAALPFQREPVLGHTHSRKHEVSAADDEASDLAVLHLHAMLCIERQEVGACRCARTSPRSVEHCESD